MLSVELLYTGTSVRPPPRRRGTATAPPSAVPTACSTSASVRRWAIPVFPNSGHRFHYETITGIWEGPRRGRENAPSAKTTTTTTRMCPFSSFRFLGKLLFVRNRGKLSVLFSTGTACGHGLPPRAIRTRRPVGRSGAMPRPVRLCAARRLVLLRARGPIPLPGRGPIPLPAAFHVPRCSTRASTLVP